MEKRLIYALQCPFTNDVHYIGKTTQGMIRPLSHLSASHSNKINEWVDNLKRLDYKPNILILEILSEIDDIDIKERFWISKYLDNGAFLLNSNLISSTLINSKLDEILIDTYTHPTNSISTFIKGKRKLHGFTQEELSHKSGVGLRFIRELEQGHKINLNINKIQEILNLFGCTLEVVRQKDYKKAEI